MGKKRNFSVFDAIQKLESEDDRAESRRKAKASINAQRARAARSQTNIYNHLVECRILMHRAMKNSASATVATTKDEVIKASDNGQSVVESLPIRDQCNALLETLLQARSELVGGDDGKISYSNLINNDDDEQQQLQEILEQEYSSCRNNWKEVFNRRHKDLKLHAGLTAKSQFRVMDSSFWEQVDATVEYERLRENNLNNHNSNNNDERRSNSLTWFDDSKVYQQLLKDFVAASCSSLPTDRLSTTQKSSSNKKKRVDRRASKGRKIRYKEIPKLMNYTFPLSRPSSSNLDQDEWFQSLFGGAGKTPRE